MEATLDDQSIFVSVPSYRDCECINTVLDLFAKARHPSRVFVGICQQNNPDEDSDIDCATSEELARYPNNIRILTMDANDAKGPMLARHLIEQHLYGGEMFFLQIDSHCLFVKDWDVEMINQLLLCDSDRPILTTYPADFDRQTRRLPTNSPPTYLRFRDFHPRLGFTEQERRDFAHVPPVPQPSLFWAAGFSFTLGQAVQEVPYDPNCPYVFIGEEMSMAIRFFTHGWDLFAPTKSLLFHLMKRTYRPTFWEQVYRKNCVVDEQTRQERKHEEMCGVDRVHHIIRNLLADDPYGVGTVRTIAEWEAHVGVDIETRRGSRRAVLGVTAAQSPEECYYKLGVEDPSLIPLAKLQSTAAPVSTQSPLKHAATRSTPKYPFKPKGLSPTQSVPRQGGAVQSRPTQHHSNHNSNHHHHQQQQPHCTRCKR